MSKKNRPSKGVHAIRIEADTFQIFLENVFPLIENFANILVHMQMGVHITSFLYYITYVYVSRCLDIYAYTICVYYFTLIDSCICLFYIRDIKRTGIH